jgi:hypothetical protein
MNTTLENTDDTGHRQLPIYYFYAPRCKVVPFNYHTTRKKKKEKKNEPLTAQHVHNTIHHQILLNTATTDTRQTRMKEKRTKNLVKATWTPPLSKQGALPENWLNDREVLVGRRTRGSP